MSRPFPKFTRGAIALVALSFVSVLGLVLAGYYGVAEPTQCALAGLFAAGAVRASYEQHRVRDRPASDAGQLRAATGLPAWVFSWLFIAIGAASAAAVTVVLSIPQVAV